MIACVNKESSCDLKLVGLLKESSQCTECLATFPIEPMVLEQHLKLLLGHLGGDHLHLGLISLHQTKGNKHRVRVNVHRPD